VNCQLTTEDCAEIYHALGLIHVTNLQIRIGYDGEELLKGKVNLNRGEAQTIHLALMKKGEHILRGAYDTFPDEVQTTGTATFELLEHIGRILAKIGSLGENLVKDSYLPLKRA
jgi:hypothetical protein